MLSTMVRSASSAHATIATICLSGTLEDKLAAAAAAGFDGVEIVQDDLLASPLSPEQVRQRCADLGLTIDLYQPFHDFEAVPPDVLAANLRRAERKFELMRRLGVDTMLVCSTLSRDAVDDDDLAAEQLRTLAERAEDHGVRIAYEALAWGRFVNTADHAWRVVRRADHPALGLCLDSFHVLARETDLTAIRVIPGAKVFALQLADAPPRHMDLVQWSTHHRLFPGQGAFDLAAFARTVLATGYDGPLSLEVSNDVFRQADPRRTAVDAMRSLTSVRETLDSTDSGPALAGHAFTEVAVDEVSGPVLAHTLTALGFANTGQHRSKPVQLWQQGEARVLLNAAPRETASPGTAEITALAFESPDPEASARRADRFLAPVLPRTRQSEEAELPSVSTPDGTTVFFCRTGAERNDWLADFTPTGVASGDLLTATDHVSLTEPFDDFDQSTLFYRTVLGLRAQTATEFAAPFGLIRSRAATDPQHRVRITLNAALYRRGQWAPAVPEPQHIAFHTPDAIATAKALRALGAPLLDIPDNYYDDLDAQIELPPELLADMRAHSVLYDRDEHGEYLHLYTEMLGSRVFFEVVQRIGGYKLYAQTYGWDWVARLATQNVQFARGSNTPGEAVTAKRKAIGVGGSGSLTSTSTTRWVVPTGHPFMAWGQRAAILARAKRPAAAKLYLNWAISTAVQQNAFNGWSVRTDVTPTGGLKPIWTYDNANLDGFPQFMADRADVERWKQTFSLYFGEVQGAPSPGTLGLHPGR